MARYVSFKSMFIGDETNNLHRHCSLKGDEKPRRWQVRSAMVDGQYAVANIDTGEVEMVRLKDMHNLY